MELIAVQKRNCSSDLWNNDNKKRLKSTGLICLVCDAPATGFNFSVITCMCCKAFFRRNALLGLHSHQCRYLTEKCSINMRTRRDCSYCRLKKCFQVGMKKELILTEDVKRLKREKICANKQITLGLINKTALLNETDSLYIRNINRVYEEYCLSPIMTYEKHEYELVCHQPIKSRIKLQNYLQFYQKHRTSLMNFFKQLPEFQQFSNEEQIALSSHNIRFLMRINSIQTINDAFPLWGAVNLVIETIYGKSLIEKIDQCLHEFRYYTDDPTCTQFLLIILLFSTSNSYTGHIDTLVLYRIQEKYIRLLWVYLNQRYDELIACKKISMVIRYCLQLQTISYSIELKRQDEQWQEFFVSIP